MPRIQARYIVHDRLLDAYHREHKAGTGRTNANLPEVACLNLGFSEQFDARINITDAFEFHGLSAANGKALGREIGILAARRLQLLYAEVEKSLGSETLLIERNALDLSGFAYRTVLAIPARITVCGWYDNEKIYSKASFRRTNQNANGLKRFEKTYMHILNVVTFDPQFLKKDELRVWLNM